MNINKQLAYDEMIRTEILDTVALEHREQMMGTLESYSELLKTNDPISMAGVFNSIAGFTDVFGNDPAKWAANIDEMLGQEGMKTQDFFRWGVDGLLIGLYLKSISRLMRALPDLIAGLKSDKRMYINRTSPYLPDPRSTKEVIDALPKMRKVILDTMALGPAKADFDKLQKQMRDLNVSIGTNPELTTDWGVVGGSFLGEIIVCAISGIPYLGSIWGKRLAKRGRPIHENGWRDNKSLQVEAERVFALIENYGSFRAKVKSLDVDYRQYNSLTALQKKEAKHVRSVVRKLFRAQAYSMQYIGRGFAALK
jgi:hypothetical protein